MKRTRILRVMLAAGLLCGILSLAIGRIPAFGQAASDGGGGGSAVSQENTFVIRETPDNLKRIDQIIKSLDVAPKQVLIEAHIFDISLTEENSTGFDWSTLMTQIGRNKPLWTYNHNVTDPEIAGNGAFRFGSLDNEHFSLLLKGLKSNNRARSLSNPKITAISGQNANISIGQSIPYLKGQQEVYSQGVTQIKDDYDTLEVPIKLTVTPIIYDDSTIRLKVSPKVTTLISFINNQPWTETRSADTELVIKAGETVIMGGLISEKKSSDQSAVPLFNKIPFVKKAFSNRAKKTTRSELVIFITPNIIKSAPVKAAPLVESSGNPLAWR